MTIQEHYEKNQPSNVRKITADELNAPYRFRIYQPNETAYDVSDDGFFNRYSPYTEWSQVEADIEVYRGRRDRKRQGWTELVL